MGINSKMNWSQYQKDIFDFVANGNGNGIVNAVAGSGKTTTIVEAAKRAKNQKVLFLAFNKKIVNELTEKIGSYAHCTTLHKLGMDAIRSAYGYVRVFDGYWKSEIRKQVVNALGEMKDAKLAFEITKTAITLFNFARINLCKENDNEYVDALASHYGLRTETYYSIAFEIVMNCLKDAYKPKYQGRATIIDFVDMLTFPNKLKKVAMYMPKYDLVFIDECQDLSTAQRELMLLAIKPSVGRFIAVGDPSQAINGFCGADCDAFEKLQALADKVLPLSCNYRCGTEIIKLAKVHVPHIEASPNAIKGKVNRVETISDIKIGDMVLCRTTAPLVSLALKYLAKGIKAQVLGKDFADELLHLINSVPNKLTITDLIESLRMDLSQRIINRTISPYFVNIQKERIDNLNIIGDDLIQRGNDSVKALIHKIEYLFSDETDNKQKIIFSTVHKAKGLENDRVFIIRPDILPYERENQKASEWQQELNLYYVAVTRAKSELTFITLDKDKLNNVTLE